MDEAGPREYCSLHSFCLQDERLGLRVGTMISHPPGKSQIKFNLVSIVNFFNFILN